MHYGRIRRNGALDLLPTSPASITDNGYVLLNGQQKHPLRRPSSATVLAHRVEAGLLVVARLHVSDGAYLYDVRDVRALMARRQSGKAMKDGKRVILRGCRAFAI